MGKPEGMKLLGRYRGRWENNNKIDVALMGCQCVDWI